MFEIKWVAYGSKEHRYNHGQYLFKWKITPEGDRYEIWESDVLKRNNLTYWEFLSKAEKIVSGEKLMADIWN